MVKKIACLFLATVFFFSVGCQKSSEDRFTFSYSMEKEEVTRGERTEISVTLTNNSPKKYSYYGGESDFCAVVELFCQNDGGEYEIPFEPIPSTCDMGKIVIDPYESRTCTLYFTIPSDAPSAEYSIRVRYKDTSKVFSNIFTLTD